MLQRQKDDATNVLSRMAADQVFRIGWPLLDDHTLAFADFVGNRQYVSTGNLLDDDRVCLFLVDYERRRRIKVWGTARTVPATPDLVAALADPSYRGRIEQIMLVTVGAWDVNCPQHIPQKLDAREVAKAIASLQKRIVELEAENARLTEAAAVHRPNSRAAVERVGDGEASSLGEGDPRA
jgi:Pyridoxamine 5'-phosphate oxidase